MQNKSKIKDQTFLFTGTLTEFTCDEGEELVATQGGRVLFVGTWLRFFCTRHENNLTKNCIENPE